jgi:cytosine deaminase
MDLIIRNAHVRDANGTVDIGVADGEIAEISAEVPASGATEIDADGGLVLPSFVESHTHLDIYDFENIAPPREEGTLHECIDRTLAAMDDVSFEEVKDNVRTAVKGYVANGTTKIRTHIMVTDVWEFTGLRAALEVKEELSHLVDLQTIAYQFHPGLTDERRDRIERALEMGADLVGGRPHTEDTDELAKRYIDEYLELAQAYDAGIDFHIDLTTDEFSRTLEYLARRTIEEGYEGRVQAAHACALSHYNEARREKVIDLVKRAGIHVNTCPKEDQLMDSMDSTAVPELLDAGVNLSVAHNDMLNTFYPFGRMDQLEAVWLLLHVFEFNTQDRWNQMIDCVTHNPARTLGLSGYGLEAGCNADLVVFREPSVREIIRRRSPRRCVLKDGAVVASTEFGREVAE